MAWRPRTTFATRLAATRPVGRGRTWVPRAALWLAGSAVLAGVVLVQLGDSGAPAWRRLRAQDAQLDRDVAELKQRNEELRKDLKALKDDPETLERLARENVGMRRPGEEVLTVRPADAAGSR